MLSREKSDRLILWLIVASSAALCLLTMQALAKAKEPQTFTGKVVRVIDGDSIAVELPTVTHIVRLAEIDAPEKNQPYGKQSKDWLTSKLLSNTVDVTVVNRDLYGRYVGRITLNGTDINAEAIKTGNAWHYVAYSKRKKELTDLEQEAREKKRGLWKYDHQIAPWSWRKKKSEVNPPLKPVAPPNPGKPTKPASNP